MTLQKQIWELQTDLRLVRMELDEIREMFKREFPNHYAGNSSIPFDPNLKPTAPEFKNAEG